MHHTERGISIFVFRSSAFLSVIIVPVTSMRSQIVNPSCRKNIGEMSELAVRRFTSSSLSHKNRRASLCSTCNELMTRGDDRGGGPHFKFHADQRETSPVSHNQHDFGGRNKQTLTELFFHPGGPRARRGFIPACHFYLLNCWLQTSTRIVHHF